jgi:hypothetical protein
MIRCPFPFEWDTSQLPPYRRAYLDRGLSFEEIASRIWSEMQIVNVTIKPYGTPGSGEPKDARQVVFVVDVGNEACDLLYNAPDGLRARYWQTPDCGFEATKYLIGKVCPSLISYAALNPPVPTRPAAPMGPVDFEASLRAFSAKVWPRERADDGAYLLVDQQLSVPRWDANEPHAPINKGMWRRSPKGGELEIKGGILGADKIEYVPEGKRDRSCQIHRFGFT